MNLALTEYRQRVTRVGGDTTYAQLQFNNLPPLLVRADQTIVVVRQVGRAVVWFGKMTAPAPVFPTAPQLEPAKVDLNRIEERPYAWETTWEYVMAVSQAEADAFDFAAAQAWPSAPVIT